MTRSRAKIAGGYARKTVSLPTELVVDIDKYLAKNPGLTMSAFMTSAGEELLKKRRKC
jgi:hypothetical protein